MSKEEPFSDLSSVGIVERTHGGEEPGTATVSHFRAGPISMAGELPGDG